MMKWRDKLSSSWRHTVGGAVLTTLLGLIAFLLWHELVFWSYDLLFLFRGKAKVDDVVIAYMDDKSLNELKQQGINEWGPEQHAELLNHLADDGARLVVFDILFTYPASDEAKARLANAVRRHGSVVVVAGIDQQARPQIQVKGPILPWPELIDAGVRHGIAAVMSPPGATAREYHRGTEDETSLPWAAAQLAGAEITRPGGAKQPEAWLNYYGPALTLPHLSYCDVTKQPRGTFRGKAVFVGAMPTTLKPFEEADLFPTPHRLWGGAYFAGVEIVATAFLNLVQNNGLNLLSWPAQFLLIVASGLFVGAALSQFRPWPAAGFAAACVLVTLVAALQAATSKLWFPWTVTAFIQIPCALAWSIGSRVVLLKFQKDVLARTLEEATKLVEATKATAHKQPSQMIPDHTLVKRVGRGAYGEVWLARNAVGVFHAAKIVQRRGFPADEPYEREFRGIQKFMPVSRTHPGLVHILHVGRNDEERYFFCIMEAGDDKTTGQRIHPETYSPKTLATELEWRGKLSPEECLQLGLALTLALDHLHRNQLIHRDIKPSNIIYVNGAPKFADIGLVTDIRSVGRDVSFLGTEGYLAPEGPGTASADVYALGKVLYEAAMGKDRRLFPEVPTAVLEEPSEGLLRRLNEVIFKACEMAASERYETAAEMHADLLALQNLVRQRPP
jgi:CHASE2 domain-containing sensor protein